MSNRKAKKNIRKPNEMLLLIIFMAIFLMELLFFTWCRVQTIGAGYEISREAKRQQDLITLKNNLKVELARLKSPERIAKIAKNQLGLIAPTPEQMMVIP
ncbi:MAG: cell division protein FtsL [Desulfobacterales bacterium]|jgi:cell division protein FtsL